MNVTKIPIETVRLLPRHSPDRTEQENMRIRDSKSGKDVTVKPSKTLFKDNVSVLRVWISVASKINVKNATPREIMSLSRKLYEAGAISYDDHINLSFQPEVNPDSPTSSGSFSHRRKDYITLWQQRAEKVIRFGGNRSQIEDSYRIQAILSYIDSLK